MTPATGIPSRVDVAVIGGGQAALAAGYYLRRSGLDFVILDAQGEGGGSWQHAWASLRAFSPAQWSSLPGWLMPPAREGEYPSRDEVIGYLRQYELRYGLRVARHTRVTGVTRIANVSHPLLLTHDRGTTLARAVIAATGGAPFIPAIDGRDAFTGCSLHSFDYRGPDQFAGQRVVVVGGGNSGAQIVADLTGPGSGVSHVTWATLSPPTFLPDEIDGRHLFEQATARYRAQQEGRIPEAPQSLGDVVMVPPVKAARERGDLVAVPMFKGISSDGLEWPDGTRSREDAIIWATGFRPALDHLRSLGVVEHGSRVAVGGAAGTRSLVESRLWLIGYGNWTGFASATLIGVGRSARATVSEIQEVLGAPLPAEPLLPAPSTS